jgi:hypothetical protein
VRRLRPLACASKAKAKKHWGAMETNGVQSRYFDKVAGVEETALAESGANPCAA